ncbi:MAG: phosphatase [Acaryochloris sp. SU_5_25]|nr:phosphatase [Acaryochloris sp. SU_5_25]
MQQNEAGAEAKLDQIQAFLALSDQVGTAGQPTAGQFADIQAAGYQRVVNLALVNSTDAIPEESEIVTNLGMDYVHIPVVWEEPTLADLSRFFAVMDDPTVTKVFVHCAKNMRVSAFMYLYRVIRQQTPREKAGEDLHYIWTPIPPWQAFIDRAIAQFTSSQNIQQ